MIKPIIKYLEFKLLEIKPKTLVYGVFSTLRGFKLGTIKWHGTWRQYTFFPEKSSLFSASCMEEIINFIRIMK